VSLLARITLVVLVVDALELAVVELLYLPFAGRCGAGSGTGGLVRGGVVVPASGYPEILCS
jgi:hypothetical protein